MPIEVMTREDFIAALDASLLRQRAQCIAKWDEGSKEHGPCVLNDPRHGDPVAYWYEQRQREITDKQNYEVILDELVRRRLLWEQRLATIASKTQDEKPN
jgi:hypothetical protein